ncbi:MAG: HesA/MoeB/ThiF family protein [Idiomarina sp.]|nr:HesA/MoeB/ThiF family protein [Idiomarina sp.]
MLSDADFLRYSRQIMLPICGEAGIGKLTSARVMIVGLGGLGTLIAPYLASAGVGHLDLCDDDIVSLSNLPRQWLYQADDINQSKVSVISQRLHTMQPELNITTHQQRLREQNAAELLQGFDLIIDCSDNMTTRQLLNRYAFSTGTPLIIGAAIGLQAQAVAIHPQYCGPGRQAGCYHCLYPIDTLLGGSCQSEGVLGPVVGMAGCYQAALALRVLLGDPQIQWSRLWRLDHGSFTQQMLHIARDPACPVCAATN